MTNPETPITIHTENGPIYLYGELPFDPGERTMISNEGGRVTAEVNQKMSEALTGVLNLFRGTESLRKELSPDEFTIEAGVKFDLETGAFFLKAGSGVHCTIKMSWK